MSRLTVSHETTYRFEQPVPYGLQRLRLSPMPGPTQNVIEWKLEYQRCTEQVSHVDFLGNNVVLALIDPHAESIGVRATGVVETTRTNGVIGPHRGALPLWYYLGSTGLTKAGAGVRAVVKSVSGVADPVAQMHQLSAAILEAVDYKPGGTSATTTAEDALAAGLGVCQDHTHIFVAAARHLGVPARYVSGYLLLDATVEQSASHAWAEVCIDGLGWVGFDVSNAISADERYIRVAHGRDYLEAAPISGVRYGAGGEQLEVSLAVQLDPAQQSDQ